MAEDEALSSFPYNVHPNTYNAPPLQSELPSPKRPAVSYSVLSPKTLPIPKKPDVRPSKSKLNLHIQIHAIDSLDECHTNKNALNLSPLQIKMRHTNKDAIPSSTATIVSPAMDNIYSRTVPNILDTTQCSTNTDTNNEYNHAVIKNSDQSNDQNNNNQNNNGYNGSSDGKDDEKKKENNNHITDSDDDDDLTSTEEKEEEEEEDEFDENYIASLSNLSVNAADFQPLTNVKQSKSAATNQSVLERGNEEKVQFHTASKSAPNTCKSFVSDININNQFIYIPNRFHRAQGMIHISKHLTEYVIPRAIKENYIENVYDFMDKYTAINLYNGNFIDCTVFRIFNYGFHDNADNVLYCIADRKNAINQRNYRYVMRDKLYTTYDIFKLYDLPRQILPKCAEIMSSCMEIQDKFSNAAALCQSVIFKTKWHKMRVFNRIHNINKQRLTFSITKTEFVDVVQRFIHNDEKKVLIPIVMFNSTGYRVEYVQIVPLRDNIHIGISYAYITDNNCKYGVKVTGIHINKNIIRNQHQLASPNHDCHCLDAFKSDIDCLHIGNPDDDKNRCKDLKKKHDALKNVNKQLIEINANMKQEKDTSTNVWLISEINRCKTETQKLTQMVWQWQNLWKQQRAISDALQQQSIITPISTQSIASNTPQSVRNTPTFPAYSYSVQSVPCMTSSNMQHRQIYGVHNNNNNNNNNHTPFSNSTPQSHLAVTPVSSHGNMTFSQFTNSLNNNNNNVQQSRLRPVANNNSSNQYL